MDCKETKDRIPEWIDQTLPSEEAAVVGQHLARCSECRAEFKAHVKVWNALKTWSDVEPDPGYVSRFWTRLSYEKSWHEKLLEAVRPLWAEQRFTPVVAMAFIIMIITAVTLYNTTMVVKTENVISKLTADEIEFVENIDLAENLDVIENMDLFEDIDVVENLPEA